MPGPQMHMYKRQKKIRRAMLRKVATGEQAEKARPIIENEEQDPLQFVSIRF